LLEVDGESSALVPREWTDCVAPSLELVLGEGRAFFCVLDLIELAGLVAALLGQEAQDGV